MDLWKSLSGMLMLQITSATPCESMNLLSESGIPIYHTRLLDPLTAEIMILRRDWRYVRSILRKKGDGVVIRRRRGLYWRANALLRRPVLLSGLAVVLFLITFLPSRVLFFRVEGNSKIPANYILEAASQCGIHFGASRREVRSEKVKNALLNAIPQLQWAGINTYGCVGVLSVRERAEDHGSHEVNNSVSSIVAVRDGVISSCTATKGNLLCKAGQEVVKGEILISGYTDCGLSIRATRAEGEVYATTELDFQAVALQQYTQKGKILRREEKYSLILGKKRINFYKGSGNLDATCDKIYEERYVQLPGGFRLPVTLVKETWVYYETKPGLQDPDSCAQQLSDFSQNYLKEQMIAGEILQKQEQTATDGVALRYTGSFTCREMIGRVQEEEIILPNGNND